MDRRNFIHSVSTVAAVLAVPALALAKPSIPQQIKVFGRTLSIESGSSVPTYVVKSDLWQAMQVQIRHDQVWLQLGDLSKEAILGKDVARGVGSTIEAAEQALCDYAERGWIKPYQMAKAERAVAITKKRLGQVPNSLLEDQAFKLMKHTLGELTTGSRC